MTQAIRYEIPEYLVRRQVAKRSERLVQLAALTGAAACIFVASLLVTPINTIRTESQLTLDPESTRGLPPDISLMTKAGTFRALAIDFAFMRMEKLKEDGKYYELNTLSSLICKMAPRFPSVWSYTAWNQAYNISVAQYTPEGRWYWVRNGIELLRNQGIRYNPKSIGLYKELGFIFWHKIGDFLDDYHWTYKRQLAVEMERILGAPVLAFEDQQVIDAFARIADAPDKLEVLLESDPEVARFAGQLASVGLAPDEDLLLFVARHLRHQLQVRSILQDVREDDIRTEFQARIELLSDPQNVDALDRLLACLRRITLREKLNMDAVYMLQLMKDYGPLDWRSPYIHAMYWASLGDRMSKGQLDLDESLSMQTVRFIVFGLGLSVKRGRIVLQPDFDNPDSSHIEMLPDSRLIKPMHEAYLRLGEEQFGDDPRFQKGTAGPNFKVGHFNALADGIRLLYYEGGSKNVALAKEFYAYLREYNRAPEGSVQEQYLQPLEKFVLQDFYDDLTSWKNANMTIGAWIERSFKHLSLGEVELSNHALNWAKKGWNYYMRDKGIEIGGSKRRNLSPFKEMRANMLIRFMNLPDLAVAPIHKARMWHNLDLPTRRMTFDLLKPYYVELCAAQNPTFDVDKAFPQPPGMAEYRRTQAVEKDISQPVDPGEKH